VITHRDVQIDQEAEGYSFQLGRWRAVYATIEEAREAIDREIAERARELLKLNVQSCLIVGAVGGSFVAVMSWPGGWEIPAMLATLVAMMPLAGGRLR
jgi:hypothetical protein